MFTRYFTHSILSFLKRQERQERRFQVQPIFTLGQRAQGAPHSPTCPGGAWKGLCGGQYFCKWALRGRSLASTRAQKRTRERRVDSRERGQRKTGALFGFIWTTKSPIEVSPTRPPGSAVEVEQHLALVFQESIRLALSCFDPTSTDPFSTVIRGSLVFLTFAIRKDPLGLA